MKRLALVSLLLITAACASRSTREADVLRPQVAIVQTSTLGESNYQPGAVELYYQVVVKNNSSETITLRQLDMNTVSSGAYTVNSNAIVLNQRIEGLTTGSAPFHIRGYQRGGRVGAMEPVLVRVIAYFDSAAGPFHHVFTQRIDPGTSASGQ